ncbi:membrane-associated protein, putative [Bodo saltans]|uniref:Membrane-associated protein, putative n=1 Tax=Bodo saltans TaxID=75058 RepID=A0A0S4JIW0_BODSA|nr:membrane-associated protein, putative [Bodo saltans]|eukprot:CUG91400.1 membrane-associated protein, putative [Bodo saltans]
MAPLLQQVLVTCAVALLLSHSSCDAAATSVPVVVSSVSRSTLSVSDIAFDKNLNLLYVSYAYCAVYRLPANSATPQLIAGNPTASGASDGIGSSARFTNPVGITCDAASNVAYICDFSNHRIRTLDLNSNSVSTLAGRTSGYGDGVGVAARFNYPEGIAHYSATANRATVLYVTDCHNFRVRKIIIATAVVTTLAAFSWRVYNLCISRDGTFLFVSSAATIAKINASSGTVLTLAGGSTAGYADGVGSNAKVYVATGIALNRDETALIVADYDGFLVRRVELSTNTVTTIAGATTGGLVDGPGLTTKFANLLGGKWFCNETMSLCGFLVADRYNNAIRFVAVELYTTPTSELSTEESLTASHLATEVTPSPSACASSSITASAAYTETHSNVLSSTITSSLTTSLSLLSASIVVSASAATITQSFSATLSSTGSGRTPSFTPKTLSAQSTTTLSSTRCVTRSASVSVSDTISSSIATKTPSTTRRTSSSSVTIFCALIPADGSTSVGTLQSFDTDLISHPLIDVVSAAPTQEAALATLNASNIVAESIGRAILFQNLPFGVNITISLGGTIRGGPVDGWRTDRVVISVLDGNSELPLSSASVVPFIVIFTKVVGRQQFLAIELQTPTATSRWLPSSVSTFRAVSLVITLVLECPTDASITDDVVVVIPCPGVEQALVAEVKAASRATQYSTLIAGPAGGGAVGRLTAVRSLVLCSGESVVTGILPLSIDACDATIDTVALEARRAIVGNLVCWVAACALMAAAVAAYSRLTSMSITASAEALGAPSPLLPLIVVTVPATVSSTFYLLHEAQCALDGVIAALGVLMCAFPVLVVGWVSYVVPRRLALVDNPHREAPQNASHIPRSLRRIVVVLFHRRARWRDVVEPPTSDDEEVRLYSKGESVPRNRDAVHCPPPSWRRFATVILIDYTVVWYACVDIAVLTVAGFLGAVGTLGSPSACRGSGIVITLLYFGQLVLCTIVRPFTTLFSHVYAVVTLSLTTLAVACQVGYLFGSVEEGANLHSLSHLLTAAAVCDLVVAGVSVLKSLLDAMEVIKTVRRHVLAIVLKCSAQAASNTYDVARNGGLEKVEEAQDVPDFEMIMNEAPPPLVTSADDDDADEFPLSSLDFSTDAAEEGDDATILTAVENTLRLKGKSDLVHFYESEH